MPVNAQIIHAQIIGHKNFKLILNLWKKKLFNRVFNFKGIQIT